MTPVYLLVVLGLASPAKEFFEGFMTGFTGRAVHLGHECLDTQWMTRVEKLATVSWENIVKENYAAAALSALQLYEEIENESQIW